MIFLPALLGADTGCWPNSSTFFGGPGVSVDSAEPIQIRSHAHPRLVAQHGRDAVWQNDAHLPAAHPSPILGGVRGSHRNLQAIAEINLAPVVHRWNKFDALFA